MGYFKKCFLHIIKIYPGSQFLKIPLPPSPAPYTLNIYTFLNSDICVDLPHRSNRLWGCEWHLTELQSSMNDCSSSRKSPEKQWHWNEDRGACKSNPIFRIFMAASLLLHIWYNFQMGNCETRKCVLKEKRKTFCWEMEKCPSNLKENPVIKDKFFSLKNQKSVS